jgi:hypothetical protein
MRWNCAFSVLVLGCYGDDKDGLPEQPTGSGFLVEEVLTSCPGPSARRFHLATVFVHEPALLYTLTAPTRRAERGLVIFGGEALDGTPLDDLWLFDLSRPWDSCPWVRLASDKSNFAGVADGELVFDGDLFWVVGARAHDGNGWAPLTSSLSFGLTGRPYPTEDFGWDDTLSAAQVGADECQKAGTDCVCGTPSCGNGAVPQGGVTSSWSFGLGTQESHRSAVCEQASGPSWSEATTPDIDCTDENYVGACASGCPNTSGYLAGCVLDPYCGGASVEAVDGLGTVGLQRVELAVAGRWAAAGGYDPTTGTLALYGGTVGCTGTACAGFEDWLVADGEEREEALYAANLPGWVETTPSAWLADHSIPDEWVSEGWGSLPAGATAGVRGAAGAMLGLQWHPDTKSWSDAGAVLLAWGGTAQQEIAPALTLTMEDAYDPGELEYWAALGPGSDPLGFLREGASVLRSFDLASGTVLDLAGALPPTYEGALVSLGGDLAVGVGGLTPDQPQGSDWVRVIDSSGALLQSSRFASTYGAAGGYDPIGQAAYVFGKFGAAGRLLQIRPVDGPVRKVGSAVEITVTHLEARLSVSQPDAPDPQAEPWEAKTAFLFEVDCGGNCWTDELTLNVAAGIDLSSLSFELVLPLAQQGAPRVPLDEFTTATQPDGTGHVVVRSPVALLDHRYGPGEYGLEVTGTLTPAVDPEGFRADISAPTWTPFGHPDGSCGEGQVLGIDGWWFELTSGPDSAPVYDDAPFGIVQVRPPAGYETVAPGALLQWDVPAPLRLLDPSDEGFLHPDTDGFDLSFSNGVDVALLFNLDVRSHTDLLGPAVSTTNSGNVWIDTCLDAAHREIVDEWSALSTDPESVTFAAETDFLAQRLGISQATRPVAIWFGRPEVREDSDIGLFANTGGFTLGANVRIHNFHEDGVLDPELEALVRARMDSTTTHELAHLHVNRKVFADEVGWMKEALPSILELERQPGVGAQRLYDGLFLRVNAFVHDDVDNVVFFKDLTAPDVQSSLVMNAQNYRVGPYLLSQLLVSRYGNDSLSAWAAVRDQLILTGTPLSEVSKADVQAFVDSTVAPGAFAARIEGATFGEPLLGLTDFALDGGAAGEVEVRQVQTALFSNTGLQFALHRGVPYYLGCSTLEGDVAFQECALAYPTSPAGPPSTLNTASQRLTLTAAGGVDTDTSDTGVLDSTQAVWMGLFAQSLLLPGQIGTYGMHDGVDAPPSQYLQDSVAATWLLHCARGSDSAYDCSTASSDADADGYRFLGDCDDLNSARFPGAPEATPTGWAEGDLDLNCDGWPVAFFATPPVQ